MYLFLLSTEHQSALLKLKEFFNFMTKKKIVYIISACFIIAILAGSFWYIFSNQTIKADSNSILINEQKIMTTINGKPEEVALQTYQLTNNSYQSYLIAKHFLTNEVLKLNGFEKNVSLCPKNLFSNIELKNQLCLIGEVGVHSENLEIIDYSNNKLKITTFKINNRSQESIASDVPMFKFFDYNNDNLADLIVYQRDYENDPLVDSVEYYYYGTKNNFVFDTDKNISDN